MRRRIGRRLCRAMGEVRMKRLKPGDEPSRTLDATDRRIIAVLAVNGRISLNDLGEQVGLSPSPCWTRVRRLEAEGVIRGYSAIIDNAALGLRNMIFIEVTLENHTNDWVAEIGAAIARRTAMRLWPRYPSPMPSSTGLLPSKSIRPSQPDPIWSFALRGRPSILKAAASERSM
jgi:DNA-binding Lrp family transcriptional regulator